MTQDRRDFLRKAAIGALFVAPVVRTLAAPERLYAQASCNPGKEMNVKCADVTLPGVRLEPNAPAPPPSGRIAPWERKPPGGGR